jgi:uncharacterized metal-binding protein
MHCSCNKPSCKKCNDCAASLYANQIHYRQNNLQHFRISTGENIESIIEKAFAQIQILREKVQSLEEEITLLKK